MRLIKPIAWAITFALSGFGWYLTFIFITALYGDPSFWSAL